jgi:hypothetical protein
MPTTKLACEASALPLSYAPWTTESIELGARWSVAHERTGP